MAILKVARLGHPVLRMKAQPVPMDQLRTPAVQRLIDDMIDTMHEYHGVGLAASWPRSPSSRSRPTRAIPTPSRFRSPSSSIPR